MPTPKPGNGEKAEDQRGLKMVLKLPRGEPPCSSKLSRKEREKMAEVVVVEDEEIDEDEEEEADNVDEPITASQRKKRRKKTTLRFTAPRPKRVKKIEPENGAEESAASEQPAVVSDVEETKTVAVEPKKPIQLELNSFQLLLDQLLRLLERKDKDNHFKNPVTEEIAPGYSAIVTQPMDFTTIREKIYAGDYKSLADFRTDVMLVFHNAEVYNQAGTVYHHSAKIMTAFSSQLFKKEKLQALAKALPFINTIPVELIGFPLSDSAPPSRNLFGFNKLTDSVNDDMLAAEILTKSRAAAKLAADKLAVRQPNSKIAFFRQHEDGSTTLNFVNQREEKGRKITLGELIGDLKEGTPGISLFSEDKRNVIVPVSQLDYGPFSSFAPRFDSTWATVTKDDSKKLLATYGDQTAAQYAQSLQAYVKDSGDYLVNMVDNILDTLTNGAHSAAYCSKPSVPLDVDDADEDIDFEALRSVSSLGIDTSYLDQIEGMMTQQRLLQSPSKAADNYPQRKCSVHSRPDTLKATGQVLKELAATQTARVSQPPPFCLTEVPAASPAEVQLASQVVSNLQKLMPLATPAQVAAVGTVRSLMGMDRPSELLQQEQKAERTEGLDMDMDLLREFLQM